MLEPSLGIVNACLPVLQPVAAKIFGPNVFAWSFKGRSTKQSGKSAFLLKDTKQNTYTSRGAGSSLTTIGGGKQAFERLDDDVEAGLAHPLKPTTTRLMPRDPALGNGITVTSEWAVQRE